MPPTAQRSTSVFRFAAFELDMRAGELRRKGVRVKVQEQPLRVLQALVENAGTVVTREELRERLWPKETFVDFDHGLNIAINKIRDALDDVAGSPRFVETIPKRGYRFLASVEQISSPTPFDAPLVTPRLRVKRAPARPLLIGIAAMLAVGIAFSGWRLTPPQPRSYTIAVLPLVNLSSEPDSDYFSDGLTDEIIHNLSLIEGLEVKSRSSSFEFKGKPRNTRDVGRQLRASLLLEGSVLRSGGKLRINADLVRVADDATIWSKQYDGEAKDVFAIQADISRSIVNDLRLQNVGGQRRYHPSLEAYDLYLRADSQANDNSPGNASRLQDAIELFQRVTTTEPDFTAAYAGIAEAYAHLRNRGRSRESGQQMRKAAETAIHLDPLLPEAYGTMGLVYASDLSWYDAEQAFRRSLRLNPNLARVREDFALFVLLPEGKLEEAVQQLQKAVELDPLSSSRRAQLAFALLRGGDYKNALEISQRILAANPADAYAGQLFARALLLEGKPNQALAILEKLGPASHGYLGYTYGTIGRRREAERLAEEDDPAAVRHQVLIYAGLGDREHCFEALQKLADVNDFMADLYPAEPELTSLRDDPRMKEFRHKRNLHPNP